jgi:hypothetical protein
MNRSFASWCSQRGHKAADHKKTLSWFLLPQHRVAIEITGSGIDIRYVGTTGFSISTMFPA